jgi:hypothetical protein
MTLLGLLSWISGPDGVTIEDFGRVFAECGHCGRFVYVEYQPDHKCEASSGGMGAPGILATERIVPQSVLRCLIELKASLTRNEMDNIFVLCTGCHFVLLDCLGEDHPERCTALMTPRRR